MELRAYAAEDAEETALVFRAAIGAISPALYSDAQKSAWCAGSNDMRAWNDSLLAHHAIVAVIDGEIVGFGDMDSTGYLDRLFVSPDFQKQGVASAICDALEHSTAKPITTHASWAAKAFFEKRGYTVVHPQTAERQGVRLGNFVMELSEKPQEHPTFGYEDVVRHCVSEYGSEPEHPWASHPDHTVFRHRGSRKWYAIAMNVKRRALGLEGEGSAWVLNVKCDPLLIDGLLQREGFLPAYHMNKRNWVSVLLNRTVSADEIRSLIEESHALTK